jgi:predicted O-linked N-acetylglucosamine transferase (SPINDLY family)
MTNAESPKQTVTLTIGQAFQQAVAHHQAGQLQDAERLYRIILQTQPNHPDANHNLGALALQVKQPDVGLPHLKVALETNPSQGKYWLSYIDALIQTGQTDAARQVLEQGQQRGLKGEAAEALAYRLDRLENVTPVWPTEHELAIAHREAGLYKEAAMVLQSGLVTKPQDASAYALLAQVLSLDKQDEPAWAALNIALSTNPALPIVQRSHARLLLRQQKLDEALQAAQAAYQSDVTDPESQMVLAAALTGKNRNEQALPLVRNALQRNPNYAEAYAIRAQLKLRGNDLVGALTDAEKALSIKPHLGQLWGLVGSLRYQLKNLPGTIDALEKALDYEPDSARLLTNLGEFKRQAGEVEAAIVLLEKAISIAPDNAGAWVNLGAALQESQRIPEAKTAYAKALEIAPEQAEVASNLGALAKQEGNWKEALRYFSQALEIKPDMAQTYNNLGATLQEMGRLAEAEVRYRRAIEIEPDLASAHSNLGNGLRELRRYAEAIKSTSKAIQINPKLAEAQQAHSAMLAHISDFRDVVKHSNEAVALRSDNHKIWVSRLFCYIYHPDLTAQEICAEHVRWGARFPTLDTDIFDLHDRSRDRRLRVGYVSPDFRGHSCRFYFEPLFSSHDRTRFELFAYANVKIQDEHTQRMKTYFNGWRNIVGLSDEAVAKMIREDQIDILVDGCGHMMDTRLTVFAHKPAPIQVTWLGSAWTTGLPQMDYVLFDPHMAPEGTAVSEKIVRLPRTWAAFRPGEKARRCAVKTAPVISNGYVTFGYTGRTERLNYKVFHAWGEILKRLTTAKLVLDYKIFADAATKEYYRDFLGKHGIDVDRVTMRYSSNIFEGLGDIDILLDSFPHNGGTMIFDALWMGVPALTLASRPPVGRIGASAMTNIGLADWVANDEYEYVDKAESFANNVEELARLRAGMRERMKASPLMDEVGFAHDVESAFRKMWHRWCSQTMLSDKLSHLE